MGKDNIFSFDTLCPEIGAKAHKNFQVDHQKENGMRRYRVGTPSNDSSNISIGVYFNNLDPTPFKPTVDPEPGNCFNCWEQGHSREECPKPKRQDFCYNCGRRDVRVSNCPRCSRAYASYWKKSRKENRRRGRLSSCGSDNDTSKLFKVERNKKDGEESEYLVQLIDNKEAEDECFSSIDNYEDVVVDEAKRSLKFIGPFLADFLKLMDAMKDLPIDTQNTVILRFVEDRRMLMNEGGMLVIKIPHYKIWDSCHRICQALFDWICKFGKDVLSKFKR